MYVGEAENGYARIKDHNKNKDFWKYAVLIISENINNQFTKTDVSFLENYSIEKTKEMKRYVLDNQNAGRNGFIPKWRKADLLNDFETITILLTTLGFPVFEPKTKIKNIVKESKKETVEKEEELFYCKSRGVIAMGELTEEGFVVYSGSEMVLEPVESFSKNRPGILNTIKDLIEKGIISRADEKYIFIEDYLFNSPSMASSVVLQRSSNGWADWRNSEGRTLNQLKREI